MRAAALPLLVLASLCSGCDPVTMGLSAGAGLAASSLIGDSKMTQEAREVFAGAPDCSEVPSGIANGHIVTRVRNIGWYRYYPMPDGRNLAASPDKSLVVVDYEISNSTNRVVLVNPTRPLLGDREGKTTPETAGMGGGPIGNGSPDDDARMQRDGTWQMISVFEVTPGSYALLMPNGRMTDETNPHRLAGCRLRPEPARAR